MPVLDRYRAFTDASILRYRKTDTERVIPTNYSPSADFALSVAQGFNMAKQPERSATAISAILGTAEDLFRTRGYADVSIDEIAQAAGYAKGAVYHHFRSKQEIFDRVLDRLQAVLARTLNDDGRKTRRASSAKSIADATLAYLDLANQPQFRRILLVDGPVVLGWQRWREIDDKHFAAAVHNGVAAIMSKNTKRETVASATRLVLGAIMEAALACGASSDPAAAAREHSRTLGRLLSGLEKDPIRVG